MHPGNRVGAVVTSARSSGWGSIRVPSAPRAAPTRKRSAVNTPLFLIVSPTAPERRAGGGATSVKGSGTTRALRRARRAARTRIQGAGRIACSSTDTELDFGRSGAGSAYLGPDGKRRRRALWAGIAGRP